MSWTPETMPTVGTRLLLSRYLAGMGRHQYEVHTVTQVTAHHVISADSDGCGERRWKRRTGANPDAKKDRWGGAWAAAVYDPAEHDMLLLGQQLRHRLEHVSGTLGNTVDMLRRVTSSTSRRDADLTVQQVASVEAAADALRAAIAALEQP